MRFAHELKPNAKTELPRHMIFVDTETTGIDIGSGTQRHYLWFGMAKHVRIRDRRGRRDTDTSWIEFQRSDDFWDWVEAKAQPRTKLYVYAHNWNFDAGILEAQTQLERRGWVTRRYINSKPPFILEVRRDSSTVVLVDSLNYFTMSLDNLGESIGIAKLDMPSENADFELWRTYCKRDVEVLAQAVLQFRDFVEAEDLGNFQRTLASQAFNAFRHRFYAGGIFIHDDQRTLELERRAYFGGRVECFRLGRVKGPLYYLDVNSLYPSVMARNFYPTKLVKRYRNAERKTLLEAMETHCVVARVRLETEEPAFPVRYNNRLVFPVGRFTTALCTPEIELAEALGALRDIELLALYERGELFTSYVDELYRKRQEYKAADNPAFSFMCKIMMNSLYGKFGQRGMNWEEVSYDLPTDGMTEWIEGDDAGNVWKYRVRLGVVQRLSREGEARDSSPAIAAHVTSYGRVLMWRLLNVAGRENTCYMDTDSLVVTGDGYRNLASYRDDSRLGFLGLERTASSGAFFGPKDYQLDGEVRMKGIRANAEQLAETTFRQDKFTSWDAHLKRGQDGFIDIEKVTKTLRREYTKGIPNSDGSVSPLRLG